MKKFDLMSGSIEVDVKLVKSMREVADWHFSHDSDDDILQVFDNESDAKAAMAGRKSVAYITDGYPSGKLVTGTLYYLDEYETDEDGEFLSGSDYHLADWERDLFAEEEQNAEE